MNPFEQAVEDIFAMPDFTKSCTVGAKTVTCIVSAVSIDPAVTRFGMDEGENFYLQVKMSDLTAIPPKNSIVTYNGTQYRVDRAQVDAATLTVAIYLKSKSTK